MYKFISIALLLLGAVTADSQNAPIGQVLSGTAGQIAYYAGNGAQVSGIAAAAILGSATAPVVASGFGASAPSVTQANGTSAFSINVGTSTQTSAGVVTMPAALHYWVCDAHSQTN